MGWLDNITNRARDVVKDVTGSAAEFAVQTSDDTPQLLIDAIESLSEPEQAAAYNFIFDNHKNLSKEVVTEQTTLQRSLWNLVPYG